MSECPPPLRESLEIPGRGRLEVRLDEKLVVFVPLRGEARRFDAHPILEDSGRLSQLVAGDGRHALLARHQSDRLHVFDADRLEFQCVQGFARLRRAEELSLHGLDEGYLVITENGIAALDPQGHERWRIDEVTSGWQWLTLADGISWFRDAGGNVVGFDATTGLEAGC